MRRIRRSGRYLRVTDPDWEEPLDGTHAAQRGGRWNPPESFPVVYLCRSVEVARANVYRLLADQPYGPEDLRPEAAPVLVVTTVPRRHYLDVITDAGCRAVGLPATYPRDSSRRLIGHARCQRIGERAWAEGLAGVASRSAAPTAPRDGEELAYFVRDRRLIARETTSFEEWFW